ncbi:MAG: TolC family protein [Pseudomonadota bacterium]
MAALWATPEVAEARSAFDAQRLRSRGVEAGREEWSVAVEAARRRIQTTPRDTQPEWSLALSRPVRLPARAAADRALAGAAVAYAEANLGVALHESGRHLLTLWFDWLGAAAEARAWHAQIAVVERQLAAVDARIRLGEVPRADRINAEAARAQAKLRQQEAEHRMLLTYTRLQADFPGLQPVADVELPEPTVPSGSTDAHVEAVLAHNHELARARRQVEFLQAEARQFAARASPDPSLGLFYRDEAGGDERVLGLSLGLTLPGNARRNDRLTAEQLATDAQVSALRLEQRLRVEARADFETAVSQVRNWQQAELAARALAEAARLAERAYALGEGSFDQILQNQRLALDGALGALRARLDALSADARLQLDSHRLWPLDLDGVADRAHAHP